LKRQRLVTSEKQPLTFEKLVIDPEQREVMLNNQPIPLTALNLTFTVLASHPGRFGGAQS